MYNQRSKNTVSTANRDLGRQHSKNQGFVAYYDAYKPYSMSPSFTAHPDLEKLAKKYCVTASSYFRRGQFYGEPAEEFTDVERVLSRVFRKNAGKRKSMLIVGIGNSQEPFSYLAVIKNTIRNTSLRKNVDMYTVDLQSKPEGKDLFIDSFFDMPKYPKYAGKSFIYDSANRGTFEHCHYRVSDDIYNYLRRTYNNPSRSKWETRIQDVAHEYPDRKFDVISANNVLPYIAEQETVIATLKELKRALKLNGYLITDPRKFMYMRDPEVLKNLREVSPGIYQKIK